MNGDLIATVSILAFFCYLTPPVVVGKLPGRWLGVSDYLEEQLNKDVFKTDENEDAQAYWIALGVSLGLSLVMLALSFL